MYEETERRIGNVTYIIKSASSEKATDTLDKKIEKLIKKDIGQNTEPVKPIKK